MTRTNWKRQSEVECLAKLRLEVRVAELEANHRLGVALMEKAKEYIAELKALFEEVPCTCDTRSPSYKCPRCQALNP